MEENPSCHLNPTCQLCTMAHYMLNHWGKTVSIGWYNPTYLAGRGRRHFVRLLFPRTKQKGCDLNTGIKAQLGVLRVWVSSASPAPACSVNRTAGLRRARARTCRTQVFCRNLRAESQFGIQSSMHLPFSPTWHSSLTISAGKLALEAESTQEMQLIVG